MTSGFHKTFSHFTVWKKSNKLPFLYIFCWYLTLKLSLNTVLRITEAIILIQNVDASSDHFIVVNVSLEIMFIYNLHQYQNWSFQLSKSDGQKSYWGCHLMNFCSNKLLTFQLSVVVQSKHFFETLTCTMNKRYRYSKIQNLEMAFNDPTSWSLSPCLYYYIT